jgi:hypothetical protein
MLSATQPVISHADAVIVTGPVKCHRHGAEKLVTARFLRRIALCCSIANSAAAGPRDGAVRLKIAKTARRTAQNMKEWRRRRLA